MRNSEKKDYKQTLTTVKKTMESIVYKQAGKRLLVLTLGASLLVQPISIAISTTAAAASGEGAAAAPQTTVQAAAQQLVEVSEETITSGAKRVDYRWANKPVDGAQLSNVHVIEIDLTNPYVKLDVMNGKAGTVTGVSSVGNMVNKSGAVAGVNADYFNVSSGKGTPIGAEVTSGNLTASTSQLTGMYAFAVTNDRKPIIDMFGFEGNVTSADGSTFALAGINKASYRTEPDGAYSHANAMYIYTSAWTVARPDASDSATTPTEVLVQNDIVKEIVNNGMIQGNAPIDGYILRTHGIAAQFVRDHLQVGQPIKANYNLIANSSGAKVDPASLQMLVGGHTILVDQGAAASFSRNPSSISPSSDRARTAVGYSKDGSKVMLVTVEDSGSSNGVTLAELQSLLVQLGVWRGINLDGGGSTTMVARPLGEMGAQLSFPTEYGATQRQIANAIGVFTIAPQGQLRGIKASGSTTMFVGQQASYAMKAYDTYYNPIDPGSLTPVWKSSDIGTFAGNTFTATKAGQTTVTVQAGSISDKLAVEVIGGDQIAQMSVDASSPVLEQGTTLSLPVRITLKDGRKMTVPAESVKWELRGFTGSINGSSLTINTVNPASTVGYAIARYDGFSAMAVLSGGADKKFEDFEKATYPISFVGTNGVLGSASVVSGLPGNESSSALQLSYDFSAGTGTKAAYAVLGASGQTIEGKPSAMTISVMGDSSFNWLRAEFVDKAGKSHLVTLADQVDWSGWKQLKVNLPADIITYPVTLKRIYAASLADGQDERLLVGSLALDNISFQFPAVLPELAKVKIELKVGSKSATVAGKPYKLDVAPLLLNNTTYLPLRFITEAMGAQINWEGTLKRVSVLRGDKLLEMWLGGKEYLLNGIRKQSDVAPISRRGRTLVPIRLVSEQLGLVVQWDGKMGTITVE
jgi:hypothetical protein